MGKVIPFKPIAAVESDIPAQIERDQWDRPKIIPPGGGKAVSYRRASTVAEVIEDHYGLNRWRSRLQAEGLAARPDLVQAIHTATRKEVMAILEEAFIEAGGDVASRNGSTMHALTDKIDRGEARPKGLPPHINAMLDVYLEAMEDWEYLDGERFVVQDKIKVAGTYDRRLRRRSTGEVVIGDLKTGQSLAHLALKTPAQVAVYAGGVHYDLDGEREPHGADKDRGLLIWLPWTEEPSAAVCELKWLDLRIGRKTIMEAFRLEDFRKLKADQTMTAVK